MTSKHLQKKRPNFHELALLLADGQSQNENEDKRWANFIDNLSRICDEFASSIHPKEKPWSFSLQSSPPFYKK